MAPIDAYTNAAVQQQERWRVMLRSGSTPTVNLAIEFFIYKKMTEDLKDPKGVLFYDTVGADPTTGRKGPERWMQNIRQQAFLEFSANASPDDPDGSKWRARLSDYLDFGQKLINDTSVRTHYTEDRATLTGYIIKENPKFKEYMALIASALLEWARAQRRTKIFLATPPEVAYDQFLKDRKDIVALLRTAQLLPLDVEHTVVDIPEAVQVAEALIGLIPWVGNMVAAYEAYTGVNLFGYHLTDVERCVLAAVILLPVAGRLVMEGRALYSEARLVALYGRDAAGWSRAMKSSSAILRDGKALSTLQKAETIVKAGNHLDTSLAQEASKALEFLRNAGTVNRAVDQTVLDSLARLKQASGVFFGLDEFAVERILLKGPNLSHIKGQLLEELLESRLVTMLSERAGSFALGLELPAGKQIEFIPGYLIVSLQPLLDPSLRINSRHS